MTQLNNTSIKTTLRKHMPYFIICIIFLIYTLGSFGFYYERTLQGDINNHILAGKMFGTPENLKKKGIKPLYTGPKETGWDGQFYYYMSNDLLALKDTPKYIDSPSYRYQRIGLSLYTAIISKLLGKSWVSPSVFFFSYLFLLLLATWTGAHLLRRIGAPPALILLWSLGVGTQITLFNALPDAAADAFLILALAAIFNKKYLLSIIPFTFSTLSREVYALFPFFLFIFYFFDFPLREYSKNRLMTLFKTMLTWRPCHFLLIPCLTAVAWHAYIVLHFGISPASQAHGILGPPFFFWAHYFALGVASGTLGGYAEAVSLLFFLLTLILAAYVTINSLLKNYRTSTNEEKGLAFSTITLTLLYACFGPTVMVYYSGYMKAAAIFFFLIPLFLFSQPFSKRLRLSGLILLTSALATITYYNMRARLLPFSPQEQYTQLSTVTNTQAIPCFNDYKAEIKVHRIVMASNPSFLQKIFGRNGRRMLIQLTLTNTSKHSLTSTRNVGSVHMSYHWLDADGRVAEDGIRSAIPGILKPGESAPMTVVTFIPNKTGEYTLKLSPVQEGCAWFYLANPSGVSSSIEFTVVP